MTLQPSKKEAKARDGGRVGGEMTESSWFSYRGFVWFAGCGGLDEESSRIPRGERQWRVALLRV